MYCDIPVAIFLEVVLLYFVACFLPSSDLDRIVSISLQIGFYRDFDKNWNFDFIALFSIVID